MLALAGGVGAARLLRGLVQVVPADQVVAVVNTGDDRDFYGVHVSPDLDIVTYTLAGVVDTQKGYGLADDSFTLLDRLATLGHETWFRLGDRDWANSLHRTLRLRAGASLTEVTDELRRSYGLRTRILPASDDLCPTLIELSDGRKIHFEEYLARDGAPDDVRDVDLAAARRASPARSVMKSLHSARAVIVCPSNPVVSIGPILALQEVRETLASSPLPIVAISPIVGGAPIKGPADRLLRGVGVEVSARGVAGLYRDFIDGYVLDERDADQEKDVRAMGLRTRVVDTLMVDRAASTRLARTALELAEGDR